METDDAIDISWIGKWLRVRKGRGTGFERKHHLGSKGNRRKAMNMADEDGAYKRKRAEEAEENEAGDAFREKRLKLEVEKVREERRGTRKREPVRTWC